MHARVDAHNARCPVTEGSHGRARPRRAPRRRRRPLAIAGDPGVETSILGGAGRRTWSQGGRRQRPDRRRPRRRPAARRRRLRRAPLRRRARPMRSSTSRGAPAGRPGRPTPSAGFETLVGGDGDDVLRGAGSRRDRSTAARAPTSCAAAAARDDLFGGMGADRLLGQAGDDELFGDPGQGDGYYTPIIRLRPDRPRRRRAATTCSTTRAGATPTSAAPAATSSRAARAGTRMDAGPGRDRVSAPRRRPRRGPLRLGARPRAPGPPGRRARLRARRHPPPRRSAASRVVAVSRVARVDADPVDEAVEQLHGRAGARVERLRAAARASARGSGSGRSSRRRAARCRGSSVPSAAGGPARPSAAGAARRAAAGP